MKLDASEATVVILTLEKEKATYTTSSNGSWTTDTNWSGNLYPDYDQTNGQDDISINHSVSLWMNLDVKSGTTITITSGDTLSVNGDVTFRNGCVIDVQSGGVLEISGNLTNNNNSDQVTIDGKLILDGNFDGGNGSSLDGAGELEITGTVTTAGSGAVFGSTDDCSSGDCSLSGSTLPVELIDYRLYEQRAIANISWSTITEINNDYFIVEKSKDLISFTEIGIVYGSGNSNELIEYSFIDYDSDNGVTYFRLKQVDFDGIITVYDILSISLNRVAEEEISIEIYPNPVIENANISISGYHENISIDVYSQDGKHVYAKSPKDSNFSIPMQSLPSAIYYIQVVSGEKVINQRLIKQ